MRRRCRRSLLRAPGGYDIVSSAFSKHYYTTCGRSRPDGDCPYGRRGLEKPAPRRTPQRKRSQDLRSGKGRLLSWYPQDCQTKTWGGCSILSQEPSKFTCTTFFEACNT